MRADDVKCVYALMVYSMSLILVKYFKNIRGETDFKQVCEASSAEEAEIRAAVDNIEFVGIVPDHFFSYKMQYETFLEKTKDWKKKTEEEDGLVA